MAKKTKPISKTLRNKLVRIALRQYEDGVRFKQPRMQEIQQNEDLYNNKVKRAPKGRFNVPLPVMGGFIDTLMSKIDDAPSIEYEYTNMADYDKAVKISAAWKKDSAASTGRWGAKDRATKRTAATAGVGIFDLYAESDPEYKSVLSVVDPVDFYCEPLGGAWLENHMYMGQDNVFRSEKELQKGVAAGIYIQEEVDALTASASMDNKRVRELFQNRQTKMRSLGLDPNNYNYAGQKVWSLVKHQMEYDGRRYFLLFDYDTGICVRCQTLREAFGYDEEDPEWYSYEAWHTHPDELNFWSKAPADDIRPVADAMNLMFNQALDNRQKRNFGQRAVDGTIFPDLEQLEWRPNGVVQGDTKGGERALREGIYEFQTPEINGTIDMITFMDNFIGTKTGITPDAQGESDEKKVGIYYGNLQQVADRLGLYNKNYSDAWSGLGARYALGIKNHMTEGYMVKIMGEDGATYEELNRDDATPESPFGIKPVGGQAEIRSNEMKKQNRVATLDKIMANQNLGVKINPSWVIEQYLKAADFEDDEIQIAKDLSTDGDIYSIAEASKVIQQILKGKKPRPYSRASVTFCQRIVNYANDKVTDMKIYENLMAYVTACIPLAMENEARKKMLQQAQATTGIDTQGKPVAIPAKYGAQNIDNTTVDVAPGGTPEGTAAASAMAAEQLSPDLPIAS